MDQGLFRATELIRNSIGIIKFQYSAQPSRQSIDQNKQHQHYTYHNGHLGKADARKNFIFKGMNKTLVNNQKDDELVEKGYLSFMSLGPLSQKLSQ